MTVALTLVILGPLGGAVLVVAAGTADRWRRATALLGLGVGVGAAIAVLTEVWGGDIVRTRGFEADPWRIGLALAAIVAGIAGLAAEPRQEGAAPLASTAGLLGAVAAACVAVTATDSVALAGALVAGTLSFGLATVAHRASARPAVWFALADVLVIAGLLVASGDGMRVPLRLEGNGSWLVLVGAALRIGAIPLTASIVRVVDERASVAASGMVLRVQGLLLVSFVAPSSTVAVAASVAAALAARVAAREASASWASGAVFAIVVAGFGLGGVAAVLGAVLVAAGAFLAALLVILGGDRVASPALGAAPLGAILPGASIVATTALARGVSSTADLAAAIALGLAVAWLAVAGVAGLRRAASSAAHPAWLVVPGLAVLALAAVPEVTLDGVARPVAAAIGAGRPLAEVPGALPNGLGLAFVVAAAASLLAVLPARAVRDAGRDAARADGRPVRPGFVPDDRARPFWVPATRAAVAFSFISVVLVGALSWVGVSRGFL